MKLKRQHIKAVEDQEKHKIIIKLQDILDNPDLKEFKNAFLKQVAADVKNKLEVENLELHETVMADYK